MAYVFGAAGAMAHAGNTNTSPMSVNYPAGISAGNLLLLAWTCASPSGVTSTPTGGWTLLGERAGSGGTPRLYGKIATGAEAGSITITAGSTGQCSAQIARFSGPPTTLTGIVHATSHTGGSTGLHIPRLSALTITQPNCLVVGIGAKNNGASGMPVPAGFTAEIGEGSANSFHCMVWDYVIQTTATNIASGTWTTTSGDSNVSSCGLVVALVAGTVTTTPPSITAVDTDNIVTATQANVTITGTNFGVSGLVKAVDSLGNSTTLSQDSYGSTSAVVDWSLGNNRYGPTTVRVENGSLVGTKAVTVNPPAGKAYYDLTTPRILTFSVLGAPSRIYDIPDFGNNVQVELTGVATLDEDGRLEAPASTTQIQYRWHNGTVWSGLSTWDLADPFPKHIGPAQVSLTLTKSVPMAAVDFSTKFSNAVGAVYTISPTIPTGLSLNPSTGILSGTPTGTETTAAGLVVRATDAAGHYAEAPAFDITVQAAPNPAFFAGTIPKLVGRVGQTFLFDLSPFFTFTNLYALSEIHLGLALDPLTGVISGIPIQAGVIAEVFAAGTGPAPGTATSNAFAFEILSDSVTIPEVIGDDVSTATSTLNAVGLSVGTVIEDYDDFQPKGLIFDQSPSAEAVVAIGSTVDLYLSKGQRPVEIEYGTFSFDPLDKNTKVTGGLGYSSTHSQKPPGNTGTPSATPKKTPNNIAPNYRARDK
jgi:hypothetical protein